MGKQSGADKGFAVSAGRDLTLQDSARIDPMAISVTAGAFAIVPSNDLAAAIPFWERLGFSRTGGDANYVIMTGWGCEVHLTQAGTVPGTFRKTIIRSAFISERRMSRRLPRAWMIWSFGPAVYRVIANGVCMRSASADRTGFSSGSAGLHALCRMRPQIPVDTSGVFRRRQRPR
jgi:hypothetical protein